MQDCEAKKVVDDALQADDLTYANMATKILATDGRKVTEFAVAYQSLKTLHEQKEGSEGCLSYAEEVLRDALVSMGVYSAVLHINAPRSGCPSDAIDTFAAFAHSGYRPISFG